MTTSLLTGKRVRLLESSLHELIKKHSLPEVLDRISNLIDQESQWESHPEIQQALNEVVVHLEKATAAALTAATLSDQ